MHQTKIENTNFIVSNEMVGSRLDAFLFKMCDFLPSRSYAAKLIKNGFVFVNNRIQKSSFHLKEGHSITINLSFLDEIYALPKAQEIPLDILFEDEHIIVINKPAGLVVHPGAGVSDGTLVNALLFHCGSGIPSLNGSFRAGIVHRLDRDTTGVMVAAKTQIALTELSKQFSQHLHRRVYHAICYGEFKQGEGTIETGHIRDPRNRIKYKSVSLDEGKRACLSYRVLKNLTKNLLSLVECTLETGRTHQIRVQMNYLNHSIVGDVLYSKIPDKILNDKALFLSIKKLNRQMLHATLLEITHPVTKERLCFTAPYPFDFESFLNVVSN